MATVLTYTTGTLTREQISGPQGSHINTLNITYHLGDGTTVQKIENTTIGILTALRNIEVNISLSNAKASFRFIDVEHENYTEMTTCKAWKMSVQRKNSKRWRKRFTSWEDRINKETYLFKGWDYTNLWSIKETKWGLRRSNRTKRWGANLWSPYGCIGNCNSNNPA